MNKYILRGAILGGIIGAIGLVYEYFTQDGNIIFQIPLVLTSLMGFGMFFLYTFVTSTILFWAIVGLAFGYLYEKLKNHKS